MAFKPAKRAAACGERLISSVGAAIGVHLIAVACFAGLDNFWRPFPGVPLRSTPGSMLAPAFAG